MIEFVSGALLTDLNVENTNASQMEPDLIDEQKGEIVSMREYANLYKLDSKQTIAFEVICCTFMIDCIERITSNYGAGVHLSGKTGCKKTRELLTKALNFKSKEKIEKLVKELKKRGGKSHLIMFLSGKGGSGKSYVILVVEKYCHRFCRYASIVYDDKSIYLIAMTGSAAALIKG